MSILMYIPVPLYSGTKRSDGLSKPVVMRKARVVWVEVAASDISYALRTLRRSPGFTAAAVLTLALGIGGSTAVFSVVDRILFRSLPYPQDRQLVSVGFRGPIDTSEFNIGKSYLDWRERQTAFQSITSMYPGAQCDLAGESPLRIHCQRVEANFLSTLGVIPVLGRDLVQEDDRPGAPRVALLSYGLWQSRFGGDPKALGQVIEIDGGVVRIAGVLPAAFEMPQLGEADVLLPEQMDPLAARAPNATVFLRTFARLKGGVAIEAARQRMLPLFRESVRHDVPPMLRGEVSFVLRSLRDRQIEDARVGSWLLFGSVLALLGLACANVTNLLFARAAARRGELAVRAALGAGRGRLLLQSMAETWILSLAGCVAGCVFAWLFLRVFLAISPDGIPRLSQAQIDGRVLLFALASSVAAGSLTGLLPAWGQFREHAPAGWRAGGTERAGLRQALVAAQLSVSLILLGGTSLLARTLRNLETEPLGFEPRHIVTASFTLNRQRYGSSARQDAFYSELEQALAGIPGVSRLALSDSMPPAGGMHARPFSNIRIAGHPDLPRNGGMVAFRYVTPGYFDVLGIPILAGRDFEERERATSDTPVILSANLARRMFGSENPVGQFIDLDQEGHWLPIVGVAGNVKNSGLAETPEPEYYRLRTDQSPQLGLSGVALLVTSVDARTATNWIKRQIAAIDRTLPVKVESMEQRVSGLTRRQRFLGALVGLFSGFGLLLAGIGIYAVLSLLVAQRAREIGIRMAVGASPDAIARMIERQAGSWVVTGIAAGLAGSVGFGHLARSLLFRVSPYDPAALAAGVAILTMAAALSAWWPARRAAGIDPAVSLRQE
jgi:putative ABC transport system permease protein